MFDLKKVEEDHNFIKCLRHPTKRKMIEMLIETSPLCSSDFEEALNINQNEAGRHLTTIRKGKVAHYVKDGLKHPYYITDIEKLKVYFK